MNGMPRALEFLGRRIDFLAVEVDIQDGHIKRLLVRQRDRCLQCADRPDDLAAGCAQHVLDLQCDDHLVFDEQNPNALELIRRQGGYFRSRFTAST